MPEDTEIDESSDVASENDYDDTDLGKDDQDDMMAENKLSEYGNGSPDAKKPKLDPKDPLRPRRKKARRACYACQRAHLTCGDERPCQRCIKRGLGDACQDGVRKKAKYLHDAPAEALRPVLGPNFNPGSNNKSSELPGSTSASDSSPGIGGFFPQMGSSTNFPMGYQQVSQAQMPPPPQDSISYISQQSPMSPTFPQNINQRPSSMQGMSSANLDMQDHTAFSGPLFDPSNPALFNFDLEGLNFGNHYGALEFGMLNHMSSGAADTPPQDKNGSVSQHSDSYSTGNVFSNNGIAGYGQMYPHQDAMLPDFVSIDRQNSTGNPYDIQINHNLPRAYAIETGTSLASPSTDAHASPNPSLNFDGSPSNPNSYPTISSSGTTQQQQTGHSRHTKRTDSKPLPKFPSSSVMGSHKRSRDPSSIYTTVTEPYSYTTGFHSLTALVQRRFSANATLKIAKSLASIRPSFISCTKTLNRQDLIFMEKCFQRTLFEYEEFMRDWGTPTLVCRRTGEVAAVNKEFTLLTGWTKNVLLGREPNLNVNLGRSSNPSTANASGPPSLTGSGRAGLATPRIRPITMEKGQEGRPQPVFLAELLDDDSVIEFYEDFAKLAFGDSRGSVKKRCNLLKYQKKDDLESGTLGADKNGTTEKAQPSTEQKRKDGHHLLGGRVTKIDGEFGIVRLERDGKMDCSYCWTVKRDVFDIPMLIVMNFLPCI